MPAGAGMVCSMDLVIVGAGGFGREVLDVARAVERHGDEGDRGLTVRGFVDDGPVDTAGFGRIDAAHLGGTNALKEHADCRFIVAVGAPDVRQRLVVACLDAGLTPAGALIHPEASIGADAEIGDGSVVCAGVRITTNVRIGKHVHLNLNATVGHDAVLEDYVAVNPLAAISGGVRLCRGSVVGTTACVNQGLTVGAQSMVGSGAAVIGDVPAGVTFVGVPARQVGVTITRR